MNHIARDSGMGVDTRPFTGIKVYYSLPKDSEQFIHNVEFVDLEDFQHFLTSDNNDYAWEGIRDRMEIGRFRMQKVKLIIDQHSLILHGREQNDDYREKFDLIDIVEIRDFGQRMLNHGTFFSITLNMHSGPDLTYLFHCEPYKVYTSSLITKNFLKCLEMFDENYSRPMPDSTKRMFDTDKLIQECSELNRFIHEIESFTNVVKDYQKRLKKFNHASQAVFYTKKRLKNLRENLKPPTEEQMRDVMQKIRVAFMYLARLKPFLQNPSTSDVIQAIFPVLLQISSIVSINIMRDVEHPHLTQNTLSVLQGTLQSQQYNFYKNLGPNWNQPRICYMTEYMDRFLIEDLRPIPSAMSLKCSDGTLRVLSEKSNDRLLGAMCSPKVMLEPPEQDQSNVDYQVIGLESPPDAWEDHHEEISDSRWKEDTDDDKKSNKEIENQQSSGYSIQTYERDQPCESHEIPNNVQKIQIRIKLVCMDEFEDDEQIQNYLDNEIEERNQKAAMGGYSIIVKQMPANFAHAQYCELKSEMKCVMDDNVLLSETHMESHTQQQCEDDEKSRCSGIVCD